MKKANGPKKKKTLVNHLVTMPQAAGKNSSKAKGKLNNMSN